MASHRHWTFGDTSLQRVIESEGPLLSPFEIFPDCTRPILMPTGTGSSRAFRMRRAGF